MWAPQYPEGLTMKIWIDNITGDVKIISGLNHYIGMRHIEVDMFPEFGYMIYIVGAIIALGILTVIINKRFMLVTFVVTLLIAGIAALVDFYLWAYDYGHNLDPTAAIKVPGMTYQPPLIGTKQLLNFTAFSGPDTGGWIFVVAAVLVIGVLIYEVLSSRRETRLAGLAIPFLLFFFSSCDVKPEPLQFGKDACHSCKMKLMDDKFGAEIVTVKGKIYKFDDVNCMLNFYNSGTVAVEDIKDLLVVNFATPGSLIDGRNALYLKSPKIKSPMASNIAAFEKDEELKKADAEISGIVLSWGEVQTQFK